MSAARPNYAQLMAGEDPFPPIGIRGMSPDEAGRRAYAAFSMSFYDQMPAEKVAGILHVDVFSVRQMIQRGRQLADLPCDRDASKNADSTMRLGRTG